MNTTVHPPVEHLPGDPRAINRPLAPHPRPRTLGAKFGRFGVVMGLALLVVFGLAFAKYRQIAAVQALMASGAFAPPPAAVNTTVVHAAQWQPTLRAIGSLEAVQGVTVSADLPGIVKEINFESGKPVKAGDILVRLVTDQEQAQLEAAQAQRDLAVYNLKRQRDLFEKKTSSQSELDTALANEQQNEALVANAKAAIERKTIRAAFSGVLGIRKVSLGQYLHEGDPVVALQSMDPIYVNFTLPQQNLKDFGVGSEVQVRTDATGDQVFSGKINATNSMVDEATRNFQAQATISNPDGKLRPGMFANVDVVLGQEAAVLPVPSSAISYAPYGDSVFVVVKDLKVPADPNVPGSKEVVLPLGVRQVFVKLGQTKGDLVAVLKGLKEGEEIVASGVFKLQNGAPVQINNKVKPEEDSDPHPEES